jgi:hypothetical protein
MAHHPFVLEYNLAERLERLLGKRQKQVAPVCLQQHIGKPAQKKEGADSAG